MARAILASGRAARCVAFVRWFVVLSMLVGVLGPIGEQTARAAAPRYPDLRPTNPSSLYFGRVTMGDGVSHHVLRFSNTVWNVGEGRLELQGDPNPNGSNRIYQNIYDGVSGGSRVSQVQVSSDIIYHPAHFHYHFVDFASYLLLQRDANGVYQPTTKDGTKTSFCIIDYARLNSTGPAGARYTSCSGTLQGLSVGWGDTYVASLPEQWVDLGTTPLANGSYAVQSTVDPLNKIDEGGRDSNNVATTYFHVNNGVITIGTATSPIPTGLVGVVVNTGGGSLNCRTAPGGSIITRLPAGSSVLVRGAVQNGWYPVTCAGSAGWVSATYLRVSGASTTPTPVPSGVIGTVMNTAGSSLICRASPGGTIIGYLPAGSSVQVRGALQGGWYPVICGAQNGWVSAAYLLVEDGTTTVPPSGMTGTVINVGTGSVYCRVSPGGTIITTVRGGSTVPVTGPTQSGWVPVTCGNRAGYIGAYYLRVTVVSTPTPTPTPTPTLTPTTTPGTVVPTATTVPTGTAPTVTPVPPTATTVPPTAAPPTPTLVPPTAVPPTAVPPTAVPPTPTPIPSPTPVPPTPTLVPPPTAVVTEPG